MKDTAVKKQALLCIDFINEIMDPVGKLSSKGYADFNTRHQVLPKVARLQKEFRSNGDLVIHIRLGFSPSYIEHPEQSPLFGSAKRLGALLAGTWATEFVEEVAPQEGDVVLQKQRVSAFYGTPLDALLRANGVENLFVCGVATDLAVEAAVRDGHDRDYHVSVVADCCAAANDDDHQAALRALAKMSNVTAQHQKVAVP